MLNALHQQQLKRGADITIAATRAEAGGDPAVVSDLLFLHQAVGNAIKIHKYSVFRCRRRRTNSTGRSASRP